MMAVARWSASKRSVVVWTMRIGFIVALIAAWLIANASGSVPKIVLPALGDVLSEIGSLSLDVSTWSATGITMLEMVLGFGLAAIAGLLVGFLLSRTALSTSVSEKILAWGYIFPMSLVYPLFLIWVGVGIPSKVLFAAVSAFFPIAYNTMKGLSAVPDRYLKVGRAYGASGPAVDWHIRAGAARPMILAGLRLGVAMATVSVVLAEMLGANAGLGFEAQQAASQFQIPTSYAYILLLALVTSVLLWIMETLLADRVARRVGSR